MILPATALASALLFAPEAASTEPVAGQAPRRATLFLDFGGGLLGGGQQAGEASCVEGEAFTYPIFLGREHAADIAVEEARRILEPYGVRAVGEPPPPWLPFTHVRIGGSPGVLKLEDDRLNGLACTIDCGDEVHVDTVFVFADKWISHAVPNGEAERELALQVGRIAVHEAGHAWGLEHTGGSESVMARFPSVLSPVFTPGCQQLDLDSGVDEAGDCGATHVGFCPAGTQNADAELLALFGSGEPDTVAPQARFVWPPDGLTLVPGETLEVEVEVTDDFGGAGWMLEVPELQWEHVPVDPSQTAISLVVPEGELTLRLEAMDHDRNFTEVEVHVSVVAEELVEEMDTGEGPQASCACRMPASPRAWSWWGLVAAGLLILRGRSRSRDATRHFHH
ncbi:MAG: matrixin family metalloprotease [Myxococcota bacterium]